MSFKDPVIKLWDKEGKETIVHTNIDAKEHIASGHYTDKNPNAVNSLEVIEEKAKANSTRPNKNVPIETILSRDKETIAEPKKEGRKNSKPRRS